MQADQFQMNVFDVWTKSLDQEEKKRKMMEDQLQKQEKELRKSKELCMKHSIKIAKLEARQDMKDASSGTDGGGDVEEVGQQSCHQNFPSLEDTMCLACCRRMANMIWFPCRHLSICNRCEGDATECPACRCKKFCTNVKISRPGHHKP